jgi:acetyl esterase/lipase
LPAGAILISPWVDLTHSFPSVAGEAPFDYIPQAGFHHKPSKAWPPPNEDDVKMLREEALKKKKDGKKTPGKHELKEKQQAPVAKKEPSDSSSRSEWINGGIPINPEKLLSVTIDGQLVKLKDQIQVGFVDDEFDRKLMTLDVYHQRDSCTSSCQPSHATYTRRTPSTSDHGRRR